MICWLAAQQLQWIPRHDVIAAETSAMLAGFPVAAIKSAAGDYRGAGHGERNQEMLYLQETPDGLLFDLLAFGWHPKRVLSAEHTGVARKVAEGVFVEAWESEDDDGNPAPAVFCITIDPNGTAGVSIRGTIARHPPFYTERNLEGTYHKVGPEADALDAASTQALALLLDSDRSAPLAAPSISDCRKAAQLLGGGDALAFVLFKKREHAAGFAVDICLAKQGNQYAMQAVLMTLGALHGGLAIDPAFALEVYKFGKADNPDMTALYENPGAKGPTGLHRELELIKMAAECPTIDVDAFLSREGITESSLEQSPYALWELAEAAARGKRFGKPNAELAFQLVLRGGGSVEERIAAIRQSHRAWKSGGKERFTLQACISSTAGKEYLKTRGNLKRQALDVDEISRKMRSQSAQALFQKAVAASEVLILESSRIFSGEEGFFSWEANSTAYRRNAMDGYLQSVNAVINGFKPRDSGLLAKADAALNEKYRRAIERLSDPEALLEFDPVSGAASRFYYRDAEALKTIQRKWIAHRDKNAVLFHELNPTVSLDDWKCWMTATRILELPAFKEAGKPR